MGIVGWLKNLFGSSELPTRQAGDKGIYLYVRLDRSGEVVRLRIDPGQDLNFDEDTGEYTCVKGIIGPKSYRQAEATFHFNSGRMLTTAEVKGGTLATPQEWEAYQHPSG